MRLSSEPCIIPLPAVKKLGLLTTSNVERGCGRWPWKGIIGTSQRKPSGRQASRSRVKRGEGQREEVKEESVGDRMV